MSRKDRNKKQAFKLSLPVGGLFAFLFVIVYGNINLLFSSDNVFNLIAFLLIWIAISGGISLLLNDLFWLVPKKVVM